MRKSSLLIIALSISLGLQFQVNAQSVTPPKKGEAVTVSNEEAIKLKSAVEANPSDESAHKAYIKALGVENKKLISQYDKWIASNPKNEVYAYMLGTAMAEKELPGASKYLLKAVELNPKNAKAFNLLSNDASRWGKEDESMKYMKSAHLASPEDPAYLFYYSRATRHTAPEEYKRLTAELVNRFPDSERGAQALYWVAMDTENQDEKIKNLEYLKSKYEPSKFAWSASAMMELWANYLEKDPAKAQSLANEFKSSKGWESIITTSNRFVEMKKFSQDKNYEQALKKLDSIKSPRYPSIADILSVEKADLLSKSGKLQQAVDTLIATYAINPTGTTEKELDRLGKLAGLSAAELTSRIKTVRYAKAQKAVSFALDRYDSKEKLSLDDLKGKVVLLTFWFPGCGPCRGEFPHFQQVIDKYKGKDVVYLGINMFEEQDPYVIPFMQNTKYTFIPLRGTEQVGKDYKVLGMPDNFLIDKKGNVIFKEFRTTGNNQRSLELMIDALLNDKS